MDEVTKQVIGQISGVVIQSIFSYMAQAGMSGNEIDTYFKEQREEFMRKSPTTLPLPSSRPTEYSNDV
jgi:hypothetical protein